MWAGEVGAEAEGGHEVAQGEEEEHETLPRRDVPAAVVAEEDEGQQEVEGVVPGPVEGGQGAEVSHKTKHKAAEQRQVEGKLSAVEAQEDVETTSSAGVAGVGPAGRRLSNPPKKLRRIWMLSLIS
mmetsp:Transcript_3366/g.6292  ORF Transcript_3366/g.6292 Transcript_3366/m.6292 type:complete len:126 (-) Transcript_3366:421-798(-)